jgi:class 3 adenylate cyclase
MKNEEAKSEGFSGRYCRKCLYSSLSVHDMIRFVRMVSPDYDINKRSGYPTGVPIPAHDAANRIVMDMIRKGLYVDFVEHLIRIDSEGFMGRSYDLRGLDDVIGGIIEHGYSYDKTTGQFMENQQERISQNWGRLKGGDERQMTVLRLDIAGNSALVKNNPRNSIEKAYKDMRDIVANAVVSRLGRLWSWEGDGALAAFMFGSKDKLAIFAGMEILHELFLYNRLGSRLSSPIKLRIGINAGPVLYSHNMTDCLKGDTIKKAVELESKTEPNSLAISRNLFMSLGQAVLNIFSEEKNSGSVYFRQYQVNPEKV